MQELQAAPLHRTCSFCLNTYVHTIPSVFAGTCDSCDSCDVCQHARLGARFIRAGTTRENQFIDTRDIYSITHISKILGTALCDADSINRSLPKDDDTAQSAHRAFAHTSQKSTTCPSRDSNPLVLALCPELV